MSPTRAATRAGPRQQSLLHGLLGTWQEGEGEQAAVAVGVGPEPLEGKRLPAGKRLQRGFGGAAVAARRLDRRQPQFAAVGDISVRPSRTAATATRPIGSNRQGSCAAAACATLSVQTRGSRCGRGAWCHAPQCRDKRASRSTVTVRAASLYVKSRHTVP